MRRRSSRSRSPRATGVSSSAHRRPSSSKPTITSCARWPSGSRARAIHRCASYCESLILNALRQLIDDVHGGRYPGLYIVITGTPAFFDGPQGIRRSKPLADRLQTDFSGDARFHNPRAPQIWLTAFDQKRLISVGKPVRDLYVSKVPERIAAHANDAMVEMIARAITGQLGDQVGIAPRLFLRRLIDVLDRIEAHAEFDPTKDYDLILKAGEMSAAAGVSRGVDDIELHELPGVSSISASRSSFTAIVTAAPSGSVTPSGTTTPPRTRAE